MSLLPILLLSAVAQEFTSSEVVINSPLEQVALRDLNHDGRLDLFAAETAGIQILIQREDGSFPSKADTNFSWPERPLGWDLVDWDGDGSYELICMNGGASVTLWALDNNGAFLPPRKLLEDTGGFLPPGLRRLRFARDVDGDGLLDIVVPSGSSYQIFLRDSVGSFAPPHTVRFEPKLRTEFGDVNSLDSLIVQSTSIPLFKIEDVDGDGKTDLVAETESRVTFFIADKELPSEPTWSLDLAALRASVPDEEGFNLNNLITSLTPSVRWRIAEIDGSPPAELIVQTKDTLKIYAGGARRGTASAPSQVLRASGPILYFFLRDTTGDDLPELQIVRSDDLSLGRLMRWIILPGELEFYLYTYVNQPSADRTASFGLKPSKRNTLAIEIPRLLSIEERIEDLESSFSDRLLVPARKFTLDADQVENDVVDYQEGKLQFYRDRSTAQFDERIPGLAEGDLDRLIEFFILEDMDEYEDGKTKTFGIEDLFNLNLSRGHELRAGCASFSPDIEVPINFLEPAFTPCDCNGDGLTDLIIWEQDQEDSLHLQFLMRNSE